ncbi:MarR family winged helix-turn-helix transcriptional regulator [Paenibacillus sp. sptzw28]|uniref:MarR family winged helix-turn-helix transcriptional regulator n=1 Tax=Paenibacillus sp. sptzw28 TaxID=715179 RepID=UPI001C6E18BE|nr:MarR family winged helix-turn-helix transcriptional regulator [Paenibacillus sp. sptzw28]QYR21868.1 MarR family winged helix-turn-helix transcriptional regulator [Paenibacillus sp. sptzw28]
MNKLTTSGSTFTELVLAVFRLNGLLLEAGDRLTEPVGLSSARWQVLGVVEHGAAPVAHVARVMGLSRQSVQQTADALEREGFIEYRENPHHRRAKLMALTPAGREALQYVERHHTEWANELGRSHSLESLQEAVTTLRKLSESLEQDAAAAGGEGQLKGDKP